MSEVISDIGKWAETRKIAVVASGDPLFFGIGATLVKALGPENVVIHPNVSTLAACFARIGTSWRDTVTVSLHGADRRDELRQALAGTRHVFVLTDPSRTPALVAKLLLETGNEDREMWVFEQLGDKSEKVRRLDPEKAAGMGRFDTVRRAVADRIVAIQADVD